MTSEEVEEKPCPKSLKEYLFLFFGGMCMGAADLVPGISGGTMAFILGFYEDLINSIKGLATAPYHSLLKLRFRQLFQELPWQFLLTLILGIGTSLVSFSHVINDLLHHELYRTYLYASFFGFVIASTVFCAKQVKRWNWNLIAWLFFGFLVAFLLTNPRSETMTAEISYPWIIICGALAISAMLLPGISGSYVLNVLGMYTVVIAAFVELVSGIKVGYFNREAFLIIGNLAIGILIGAIVFSGVISWLFKHFHDLTIALLTGLMIGALRAIWPFQHYTQVIKSTLNSEKIELATTGTYVPALSDPLLWKCIGFAVIGFIVVFTLEYVGDSLKKSR